jgi:Domain of unknown function (DUF2357)
MGSSPTSEPRDPLPRLRFAVRGDEEHPGLAGILPRLQHSHRRELRRAPHWSKEELVRHPEPRELIRSMRKPGNLDAQGRPVYTLDERRYLTADVYENRMVRSVVEETRMRLRRIVRANGDAEAADLLRELDAAVALAPFLDEVGIPTDNRYQPTATLTKDPLYRSVLALRS